MDVTPGAERIFAAIRAIPRGQVAAYGEVARRAGLPGRARWVARLLAGNADRDLPWHRVLRADGRIAFAAGSDGFNEQCQRLRREGVAVVAGRVRGLRATATLDVQVWGDAIGMADTVAGVGLRPGATAAGRSRKPPRS